MQLTPYARNLLRRHGASLPVTVPEPEKSCFYRYPPKRLVYAPRKSGAIWMCMKNREVVSEHPTRAEAIEALSRL